PDSALIFSPAANSTRTMGNAPGNKISLLISSFPPPFLTCSDDAGDSEQGAYTGRGARTGRHPARCQDPPHLPRYPSIHSTTRLRSFFEITHSKLAQRIFRHLVPFRTHIDPKNPCSVTTKDLFLYLTCQRLIAMPVDQLIGNLKSPKCFDLPLRGTIPDGIRAPKHVIHAERVDDLSKHMRANRR